MKNKIQRISKYAIVGIVAIWSIYNIIRYSIKLSDCYNKAYILGIVLYSLILITTVVCIILLIKKAIYRDKFTHNDYE